MEVSGEGPLGKVRREHVGVGDLLLGPASEGGQLDEAPDRLRVPGQPRQLVPDVAGPIDAVRPRREDRRPHERIQDGQLVADCREAVVLDEGQRCSPGHVWSVEEEHPFPGNEDVVEDRQRLDHLV